MALDLIALHETLYGKHTQIKYGKVREKEAELLDAALLEDGFKEVFKGRVSDGFHTMNSNKLLDSSFMQDILLEE